MPLPAPRKAGTAWDASTGPHPPPRRLPGRPCPAGLPLFAEGELVILLESRFAADYKSIYLKAGMNIFALVVEVRSMAA
jgi:hypothetical protein